MTDLQYGGKPLEELDKETLVQACQRTHEALLRERDRADAILKLMQSPYPIHALWRNYGELSLFAVGLLVLGPWVVNSIH